MAETQAFCKYVKHYSSRYCGDGYSYRMYSKKYFWLGEYSESINRKFESINGKIRDNNKKPGYDSI